MVKKQMSTLDRNTVKSLKMMIEGASSMYLQDNEFWEIVEQKFVDEGLHRYYSLEDLSDLLCAFGRVGRGSDDMVEIIEKHFIKHILAFFAASDGIVLENLGVRFMGCPLYTSDAADDRHGGEPSGRRIVKKKTKNREKKTKQTKETPYTQK